MNLATHQGDGMALELALPRPSLHQSRRLIARLALVATAIVWGTSFVAAQVVMRDLPPLTFAVLRFAIALAVLLPLTARLGSHPARGWLPAVLGLSGVSLFFLCQNIGLQHTTAANASLINNGGFPIMTALLAAVALGERLSLRRWLGVLISLAGVAVVVLTGVEVELHGLSGGDALILASAGCIAVYTVVARVAAVDANGLALVTGSLIYGLLFLLPAVPVELAVAHVGTPSLAAVVLLVYLGVVASGVAYWLFGFALRYLSATETAVISNLEVVVGVAVAVVALHERLSAGQITGGILILLGIWLSMDRPAG